MRRWTNERHDTSDVIIYLKTVFGDLPSLISCGRPTRTVHETKTAPGTGPDFSEVPTESDVRARQTRYNDVYNIVGDIRRAHPSVFGGATGLLGRRSALRAPVKRKGLHNNGGNRFGPHCPLAGVVNNNNNNDNIIPMHSHTHADGPNHL